LPFGGLVPVRLAQQPAGFAQRRDVVRVERQRLLEGFGRLVLPAPIEQRESKLGPGTGLAGIERDRAPARFDGFFGAAARAQRTAQIRPDGRKVRAVPRGVAMRLQRIVAAAAIRQHVSEIAPGLGVIGLEIEGALVGGNGLVAARQAFERRAAIEPALRQARGFLDGPLGGFEGLRVTAQPA
jgi:hypothetical protein